MAIISGVMQMAGTGEQLEDIGDARSAISSLLGIPTSVSVYTKDLLYNFINHNEQHHSKFVLIGFRLSGHADSEDRTVLYILLKQYQRNVLLSSFHFNAHT